jgi:hypothetical protein
LTPRRAAGKASVQGTLIKARVEKVSQTRGLEPGPARLVFRDESVSVCIFFTEHKGTVTGYNRQSF